MGFQSLASPFGPGSSASLEPAAPFRPWRARSLTQGARAEPPTPGGAGRRWTVGSPEPPRSLVVLLARAHSKGGEDRIVIDGSGPLSVVRAIELFFRTVPTGGEQKTPGRERGAALSAC